MSDRPFGLGRVELDQLGAIAKARGYDAFIPTRPEVTADPGRYDVGWTCHCRPDGAPQVLRPALGGTAVCPSCGSIFHRFADGSGVGVKTPRP